VQSAQPMPAEAKQAIGAWNCLGGEIRLTDEILVAMEWVGMDDAEQMIRDLITIRDTQRAEV
jgi:hypothetical protein